MGTEMILLVVLIALAGVILWQLLGSAAGLTELIRLITRPAETRPEYQLALRYIPCEDIVDFRNRNKTRL